MKAASALVLAAICMHPAAAQTFQVGGGGDASQKPGDKAADAQGLGWGSNIQNARLARSAEQALEQGDKAKALDYAERAAQAAPNDAQLWFLLGYAARLNARYGRAVDAYGRGLRLSPGSVEGMSGLAQTYGLMGRNDEAERLLRQVIAANPGRVDDLLFLGDLLVRSGKYADAVDPLLRAERARASAQPELLLSIAYQRLGQPDQASHYLLMAKGRSPNNPDVERALAAFYRQNGEYDKAVEELKSIRNPKPDVMAELAYTYELDGKLEEAAPLYAQAAQALPRDLNLQLSAAQAFVSLGTPQRAEAFLASAAKIDPNAYRLHAIRAEVDVLGDRKAEAVAEYVAATDHVPANPPEGRLYPIQLRMDLVALYDDLNDGDKMRSELSVARRQIDAMDEQGPDRASLLRLRAIIKMRGGETEAALKDMEASLALTPNDRNSQQIEGDLLVKLGRTEQGIAIYRKILAANPKDRAALTSLGYAARIAGDDAEAEKSFRLLAEYYPNSYVPYLALGDMYLSHRAYQKALDAYGKGYGLAPHNVAIVAGGMNAAIEAHQIPLAGTWMSRVEPSMRSYPTLMREQERYLYFTGRYEESAAIGRRAIEVLPKDREVVVYLGYDLLRMDRYQELLALVTPYQETFPRDPDIPLLAGYVYKHDRKPELALEAFTEALRRDPNVLTAHINRGFVLNDLHRPAEAAADFRAALAVDPGNGETHLGLAFAELSLGHPRAALHESQVAEKSLGDSGMLHVIRATAYGREHLLEPAAREYRAAIRFSPNDGALYLGLANALFAEQQYRPALDQLAIARKLLPDNAEVFAMSAQIWADLNDREQAMRDVALAEKLAAQMPPPASPDLPGPSGIYVSTGEALSILGDQAGALDRFTRALEAPGSNRGSVRMAIARLMAGEGRNSDAERQIALARMEAEAGDTRPLNGDQYVEAAGVLQSMHEYELSQTYLEQASTAGASEATVRIARANNYLAVGDTTRAAAELSAVKQADDSGLNYAFLLAQASLYQQQHQTGAALSSFAEAASVAGENQIAEQSLLLAGAAEGYRLTPRFSLIGDFLVQPIFEDSTVYVLDSKLNSPQGPVPASNFAELPTPRSSVESDAIAGYHLHAGGLLPNAGGFVELRDIRGTISVPATDSIVRRNTIDTVLNFGVAPTMHMGTNAVTFNTGIEGTLRRDTLSPVQMNQNLFRAFTYGSTTSFWDALSATGYFIYERGPFTETPISSAARSSAIDFRVGAPWSKTALVTGWGLTDQQFPSTQLGYSENHVTTSYVGLSQSFGARLKVEGLAEDIRSWRIEPFSPIHSAFSQALRPAGTVAWLPGRYWTIEGNSSYESTRGFHVYDFFQNGGSVSYTRPLARTFNDTTGEVHLKYPIRLSLGVQEETFPNFSRGTNQQLRPYVSLTLF